MPPPRNARRTADARDTPSRRPRTTSASPLARPATTPSTIATQAACLRARRDRRLLVQPALDRRRRWPGTPRGSVRRRLPRRVRGRSDESRGQRYVPVDAPQPSVAHEAVDERVVPVPLPREPAPQLAFGRDDGGSHACERATRRTRVATSVSPARRRDRPDPSARARSSERAPSPAVTCSERATIAPQRSSGERVAFSSFGLRSSSTWRSAMFDGPAAARWSSSRSQSGAVGAHALDLGAADRIEQRGDAVADEHVLAAVHGDDRGSRAPPSSPEPGPLRPRPLAEAAAPGLVRLLVERLVEARQRRVGRPRQQAAVDEELLRFVERLQRPVRRQAAFERAPLSQFVERLHVAILAVDADRRNPHDRQRAHVGRRRRTRTPRGSRNGSSGSASRSRSPRRCPTRSTPSRASSGARRRTSTSCSSPAASAARPTT